MVPGDRGTVRLLGCCCGVCVSQLQHLSQQSFELDSAMECTQACCGGRLQGFGRLFQGPDIDMMTDQA